MQTSVIFFIIMPTILFSVLGCSHDIPKTPEINIFDAIGQKDVSVVKQHMAVGTNLNESFVPQGYPWAGANVLHLAALVGNEEIFQLLIDNGGNIEIKAKDQPGGTPLQWAAFWGVQQSVEFIITAGANVNAKDNNGCTPLCATIVPNPFIYEKDKADFKGRIVRIQQILKVNGGRVE
jgi:hypothetical protein